MSTIARIFGWVLMLSGIGIFALVGMLWLSEKDVVRPAGQSWAEGHSFSLTQSQHLVQQYVSPDLWDSYIVPVLGQPTWLAMVEVSAAFLVLGVLLLQLGHRSRPGDRFRQAS